MIWPAWQKPHCGTENLAPSDLHRVVARRVQPLDGDDIPALDFAEGGHAAALGGAVDVDGAGAADTRAAAVLGAVQPGNVADGPEQGHFGRSVDVGLSSVQEEFRHDEGPSGFSLEAGPRKRRS